AALEGIVKAGLALNCRINMRSAFDRKNYFYPDLPKAYQTTQDAVPVCEHGWLEFELDGESHRVGIRRIHLEEEAGKSVHSGDSIIGSDYTLIDYNRAGIPLIEIVTEPHLRSPEQARAFLEALKAILEYADISDCKMEEGSLRCDANISLRPKGSDTFGTKTEVKNMNSFRAVQRALAFEARRQAALLDAGEPVVQETRAWDEARGVTVSMRTKGEAEDYRYFPDPEILPVQLDEATVERWRQELPELPAARRARFVAEYGIPEYDAGVLTADRAVADFFEEAVKAYRGKGGPKAVSNWVMGEFLRMLKEDNVEVADAAMTPSALCAIIQLVEDGVITGNAAKEDVFPEVFRTGRDPQEIVEEKGLRQISDAGALEAIIQEVIAANPGPVEEIRQGKDKAIGFLVGQVMRQTKGKANPKLANELLRKAIGVE